MTADERLTAVFDRAMQIGVDGLSPIERELYLIQYFILELEMNSLSGVFYNQPPDLAQLQETVDAMRHHGLNALADLLADGLVLFRDYVEPHPPSTCNEILRRYDPSNQLNLIESRMIALNNYGLSDSSIGSH